MTFLSKPNRRLPTHSLAVGWTLALFIALLGSPTVNAQMPGETEETVTLSQPTGMLRVGTGVSSTTSGAALPIMVGAWLNLAQDSPVMVGLDSGLIAYGDGTVFPLMLTVASYFSPIDDSAFQPFVAGSLGPAFGTDVYSTSVAALFRPGVMVNFANRVDANIELPLGTVNDSFYIGPQANLLVNF